MKRAFSLVLLFTLLVISFAFSDDVDAAPEPELLGADGNVLHSPLIDRTTVQLDTVTSSDGSIKFILHSGSVLSVGVGHLGNSTLDSYGLAVVASPSAAIDGSFVGKTGMSMTFHMDPDCEDAPSAVFYMTKTNGYASATVNNLSGSEMYYIKIVTMSDYSFDDIADLTPAFGITFTFQFTSSEVVAVNLDPDGGSLSQTKVVLL